MGADHGSDLRDIDGLTAEDLAAVVGQRTGGLEILDVLDHPGIEAGLVALARIVAQPLERAGSSADALDRGDLLLEGEDWLDLQRRADPGTGATDPATPSQVLEGVDREPHLQ